MPALFTKWETELHVKLKWNKSAIWNPLATDSLQWRMVAIYYLIRDSYLKKRGK